MPYVKKGKYYWRKGRKYTLKQVQAIHINKFRKSSIYGKRKR